MRPTKISGSYYYIQDNGLLTREGPADKTVICEHNGDIDKMDYTKDKTCDEGYMFASTSSLSTTVSKHSIEIKFKLIRTRALRIILFKNLLPGIAIHLANIINVEMYPENYQVLVYRVQLNLIIMTTHAMLFVTSRASPSVYTIIDRIHSISSLLNITHMLWTWLLFRRQHFYWATDVDLIVTTGLIGLYIALVIGVIVIAIRERGELRWNEL